MEQVKSEKVFFNVFPTLKVGDELQMLFSDVEVKKITTNSGRDFLHIHILCRHLIQKKQIWLMEQRIKEQLFGRAAVKIEIVEEFQLSELYTPQAILTEYRESLIEELRQTSVLAANMFARADLRFEEGNLIHLELLDTIVSEGRKEEIVTLVERVLRERFRIDAKLLVAYKETDQEGTREYDEQRIQQEINAIFERRARQRGEEPERAAENQEIGSDTKKRQAEPGEKAAGGKEKAAAGKEPSGRRKEFQKKEFKKKDYVRPLKLGDDPNLIYGRNFEDEPIRLDQVVEEMGEITFHGKIISLDTREIKNERTIIIFAVSDFTDTISVKMFIKNEQLAEILGSLKKGGFVKIKGVTTIDKFDGELTIGSVTGIKKIGDFTVKREDLNPLKRVELHCHTKMSDMDGVSEVKDIVKRAHDWGHPAIAITDHGVAQAFPDANHYIETLDKDDPFKVLYGVEGYVVDDLTKIAVHAGTQTLDDTYIVFDIETTGFSAIRDKIIEIGAVKVVNGEIVDRFSTFVNPQRPIPFEITNLTSITDEMVLEADPIENVLPQFLEFVGDGVLVAHNASFDVGFIEQNCRYQEIEYRFTYVDTVAMARVLLPTLSKYKLNLVAKTLGISLENHHRAVDDAGATAEIFVKFVEMLKKDHITDLKGINRFGERNVNAIRKMATHHIIILAKNDIGRYNLYQLISESHMTYYGRRPRIPKSLLNEHREGLVIGSACEAGELYKAILEERPAETIAELADFYDYYEIQPIGNNRFMIGSSKVKNVNSEEDLQEINRKIVELGEQFKKPVVATCDVHFLDPEDEVYRRIIMAGKGFDDADTQPPLFLRTTDEMLEEFAYLGSAKAREVVIDNPQKIAKMIEKISPVNPNKCPPVIQDSDQELRDICYRKAHEMYGEDLPVQVSSRLEKELNSIISNGYAVMYIIAQKLVWKSNEDGYLVGSRGSVGSSFVATMAGITEVNPLSAHYYCPKCHYYDFDSEDVKKYVGSSACDMPDKKCPRCGEMLCKEGHDIPFETFLGFKGDKEPDIDLNFSSEYQSNAHDYTEVIFGAGHTFRAGTVGTLAEKTAYGYVKKYYEEREQSKRGAEIERISQGCVGVRRSTGQHPGGIVVLPMGEEIYTFTPVQHPANDMTSKIITTHFDYHKIDANLLKLDILGHQDPTMIRMLEDLTGVDASQIRMDDKEVLSLFESTEALGIKPEDIDGCPFGCLGLPEFGTPFVHGMLKEAKPKNFSDLVRISGLSHGTDVWLGNAQYYISTGDCTLSTAICTRDDIMIYLIHMGVENERSFKIMESVRKGKGLTPDMEEDMRACNVPDWYIESCKKIKYMFPKAHAAAYVMMALRVAYFKVHYPLSYYAAFFSIRATSFNYELMCLGKERLGYYMDDYKKRKNELSDKEKDTFEDMKIVQEMYARGFEFVKIDIYRAKANRFQIVDGKLMPAFSTIDGLGDKAAEMIEDEASKGKFLSREDFKNRCKVSEKVVETMADLGLMGDLPHSNQISLMDFMEM